MSSSAKIINPLEQADWNELVISAPDYSFFHSSNWARVLHDSYGYKPVYSVSIENDRISALLPCMEVRSILTGRRGVSLPFTDYCDPVIFSESSFKASRDLLIEYGKDANWDFIEFRGGRHFPAEVSCSGYYLGHILQLQGGEEEIYSGFRDSTARNIKKAVKMGVDVEISTARESMDEFRRLNCITRKLHGLPPQPGHFFDNVYEQVIAKNLGMIVLAYYNKQCIAGAVFFQFGDRAYYKYGASDRKHQELRANNLVMWEAIRWLSRGSFKTLCFGRTEPGASGLRQFKSGWGSREQKISYFRYDLGKERVTGDCSPVQERFYPIFHALPIPLSKIAGLVLYRHMG